MKKLKNYEDFLLKSKQMMAALELSQSYTEKILVLLKKMQSLNLK